MAESIVSDWLSDYASLQPFEIRSFASQHEHNHEIAHALFTILNERLKYPDLLHSICNQFYSFYRSSETVLRKFTLQFVPTLIYIYLNSVAQGDKKSCRSVETLLISVYNIEITNDDGQAKTVSFRMPVLAQASIYHEEKSLHASDLRRWEENSNKDVNWGPLQQVESINAQNRLKVVTALMFVYNQQLSLIPKAALAHLCRISSQLANQGFSKLGHAHRSSYGSDPNNAIAPKPLCRIPMSSQFLLELLHAVYFAMFNEFGSIAIQSVDDIHNRACYELFPEVILVTNAIKNSLHANPSGQPSDGPMGISVALTPTTSTVTVSKSMITNASFRTKKLPDDIEVATIDVQHENGPIENGASPKENRKNDQKKRWKNWGWKYSPGGKTSSIEEEPDSPKQNTSRHSSPNNSPKHKKTELLPSPLRRKLTQSPNDTSNNRTDIRSSAGARLCQLLDDNSDDCNDELQALLVNGRPANDIPIQGAKDDPSQLLAITEELETEPTLGNRNTTQRGSKDNPKLHKVPFPGFKKSKDKETKNVATRNGSIDIVKEPTKSLITKLTSRGSNQVNVDIGDGLDRQLPPLKQKNSSNDILNGVPATEMVPMQSLTNGGGNADDKLQTESHNTSVDTSDSIDTTSPDESIATQHTVEEICRLTNSSNKKNRYFKNGNLYRLLTFVIISAIYFLCIYTNETHAFCHLDNMKHYALNSCEMLIDALTANYPTNPHSERLRREIWETHYDESRHVRPVHLGMKRRRFPAGGYIVLDHLYA
ncbi:Hyccin, partial [Pseudolycoriella hygida]